MNLFDELLTQDMPDNIKDVCTQAQTRTNFLIEIEMLGNRIRGYNTMINDLSALNKDAPSITLQLSGMVNQQRKLTLSTQTTSSSIDFNETIKKFIEDLLELYTSERIEAAHQLSRILSKK